MNHLYKSCLMAGAALLIATLAMGQNRPATPAAPAAAPNAPPPTKLAVVNLVVLLNGLDEFSDYNRDAKKMQDGFAQEAQVRQKAITEMGDELKDPKLFKKESAEYKKLEDDYLTKSMDYQTFTQFVPQKMLLELRLKMSYIYKKVDTSIASYAQANGIALVFLAEEDPDFGAARSGDEVRTIFPTRKILYSHPDFDITTKLKEKMNSEYATIRKP